MWKGLYQSPQRQSQGAALSLLCSFDCGSEKIIPFFRENQLRTAKREDFEKFARVLELMGERKHLNSKGIMEIASIAQTMNRKKPSRFLESSETTRQAPPQEVKI